MLKRRSARDAAPKVEKVKKIKTPRRRRKLPKIKIPNLLARLRARRKPLTPVTINRWELVVVTTLAIGAVLAVVGFAAVISYSHMHDWATANHEPEWRAKLFPLSVDGAIMAAALVLYADSRSGRKSDRLAYLITVLGIGWSVGANIGHDWVSTYAAKLIAGWPPIAMAISVELLLRFVRRWRGQVDTEARRAARKVETPKPAPAPRPAAEEEPKPKPALHAVPSELPDWIPAGAKATDAVEAYLALHPYAEGKEVDAEVGKYFPMADGYARRLVRKHQAQRTIAQGE